MTLAKRGTTVYVAYGMVGESGDLDFFGVYDDIRKAKAEIEEEFDIKNPQTWQYRPFSGRWTYETDDHELLLVVKAMEVE